MHSELPCEQATALLVGLTGGDICSPEVSVSQHEHMRVSLRVAIHFGQKMNARHLYLSYILISCIY